MNGGSNPLPLLSHKFCLLLSISVCLITVMWVSCDSQRAMMRMWGWDVYGQIQALCTNLYIHYTCTDMCIKNFSKFVKGEKKIWKNSLAFKGGIPIYIQMPPAHETSGPLNVMFVLVVYKTLLFPLTWLLWVLVAGGGRFSGVPPPSETPIWWFMEHSWICQIQASKERFTI